MNIKDRMAPLLESYDTAQTLDLIQSVAKDAHKAFKAGKKRTVYERLIYVPKWLSVFLKNEGHTKAAGLADQLTKEITSIYRQQ